MAVRASMTDLVNRLRSVTGAATDDNFQGVVYWTGEQLQAELDARRTPVWAAPLTAIPRKIDGSTTYLQFSFSIPRGYWLENDFTIRDFNGAEVTAPTYTVEVNELQGRVVFDSDVGASSLTIDFAVFDWNAAAAGVWEQKAAHRFDYINFKAADHKFDASAEYQHCDERAKWHAARKVKSFSRLPVGYTPPNHALRSRR